MEKGQQKRVLVSRALKPKQRPAVKAERWTRVAVTREDGTLKIWLADEEVARYTGVDAPVFDGPASLTIAEHFRGLTDEARISSISREGQFGVVEEQYNYNPRNQLVTRRIGTPTVMDEQDGGGASIERYHYDNNGNTTDIEEYTRAAILMNHQVAGYHPEQLVL